MDCQRSRKTGSGRGRKGVDMPHAYDRMKPRDAGKASGKSKKGKKTGKKKSKKTADEK